MHYLLVRLAVLHQGRLLLTDPTHYKQLVRALFLGQVEEVAVGLLDRVTRLQRLHPDAPSAAAARVVLLAAPRERTASVAAHGSARQVIDSLVMIEVAVVAPARLVLEEVVVGAEHHVEVLLLRLRLLLAVHDVPVVTQNVHHVRLDHHDLVVDLRLVGRVRQTVVVLHVDRLLRVRRHGPRVLRV